MLTLNKSEIPENFEELVKQHIEALEKHRFTKNVPAPVADSLVEAAIIRVQHPPKERQLDEFKANYEIIDDTPPPPSLREKKAKLIRQVEERETYLIEEFAVPAGKVRSHSIKFVDILNRGGPQTPEEEAFMAESRERTAKLDKINRNVAEVMSAIEDLTEDNIDSFVVPELT